MQIVVDVRRHAQKGPEDISNQGRKDAFNKGQEVGKSGVFDTSTRIRGYHSQMARGPKTLEAFFEGFGAESDIPTNTADKPRPILLGYGTTGPGETFWGYYIWLDNLN